MIGKLDTMIKRRGITLLLQMVEDAAKMQVDTVEYTQQADHFIN